MTTKLKICGIRSVAEIEALGDLTIDYFGCIFATNSKRYVSIDLATSIVEKIHQAGKQAVGVFVDTPLQVIQQTIAATKIDIVQLHGSESPLYCQTLQQEGITLWKAFAVWDTLTDISAYLPYIQYPLFDTKGTNKGGNGIAFQWEVLKGMSAYSFVLAGGIEENNLQEALSYQPAILDVNSKVEINDRKNRRLIQRLIEKLAN